MRANFNLARRDPEDRIVQHSSLEECKEKMLDKTLADSFPASDPLSSLPDPCEDSFAKTLPQAELPTAA